MYEHHCRKFEERKKIFLTVFLHFLTYIHFLNKMTGILILFLFLIHSTSLLTSKLPAIHHCQVEHYTETINLGNCLNTPISIKTTRCRGQCYSEDFLIYDWQYAPNHFRHKHHLHCCLPTNTKSHETQIRCENNQLKTLKYQIITQCECKLCTDKCLG